MLSLLLIWVLYSLVSHRIRPPKEAYDHTLKVLTYNTHAMMIGDKLAEKKKMLLKKRLRRKKYRQKK